MAEVLGVGLSHYPLFGGLDENMASLLQRTLTDPGIPAEAKDVANWPELARREWADDEGRAAAKEHRAAMVDGFERVRAAIDDFNPDALVIWGDDQYENFKEDIIPPYAVLAYPTMDLKPWAHADRSSDMRDRPNVWGEDHSTTFQVRGRPDIAKYLASGLLEREIDVSYAYRPAHHPGLPHAFLNAVLYLDYHRTGFDYPVVPFPINCYGRRVVSYRGFMSEFGDVRELDPPSPSPRRLMRMGAEVARLCAESPWRIALVASSSWSHAFLCDRTWRLHPDTPSDVRLYQALAGGDLEEWRATPLQEIEAAGQQELLNWFPLVAAMEELGHPTPVWSKFVETAVFNSNKVFAIYGPSA
ncbi:extradiol ring-cleavage dioxygenase [Nonomuraea cavernae]|uniref:Extradiol ring-cleavage dioxygenase n=1 Tax=Nonomuraea cavernae TaxID=2045107 RepID=A0A917YWW6_9ACTN|nr:extradiol ring-cleavage dioxygenase [Nonomuraea cavernae]MCA2187398.1 hypothetical protein [Nonomuraea cavernae]GGO68503.1 hypothetical protein GCM10012289_27420 [Nonomuraea cavernae]